LPIHLVFEVIMISMRHNVAVLCLLLAIVAGCGSPSGREVPAGSGISEEEGVQIGDLADMPELMPSLVEGYGIVAGLGENGSSECPLDVLSYLKRYTRVMMPTSREDPENLIRSKDTAVVKVTGRIKPGTRKGGHFDVMVSPIQGSQTRSLAGGQLYTTELMAPGKALAGGQVLAAAGGPVFTDTISQNVDIRTGWVLGGGSAYSDYPLFLKLKKPDFKMASAIRNRIIQRFGPGTAVTENEVLIVLTPPKRFESRGRDFVTLVKAIYVVESDELNARRAAILSGRLASGQDMARSEASLIGLGRISSPHVRKILGSENEDVRLRAARVMLSYGEYDVLGVLRAILYDSKSGLRMEAIHTIAEWAPAEQTCGLLSKLLGDADMAIRLAAVDELVQCGSSLVARENVGGKLFLDIVESSGSPVIYATRTGGPRIVLFGRDLKAQGDVFLTAADNGVTLNGRWDSDNITVIRHRRSGTGVVGQPLVTSRLVADIIRNLSASPMVEGEKVTLTGLNVAYSDTLEVLKLACEKGYVKAAFVAGEMEKTEGGR
jgi:flagellar basal body P-ring protein FlgI